MHVGETARRFPARHRARHRAVHRADRRPQPAATTTSRWRGRAASEGSSSRAASPRGPPERGRRRGSPRPGQRVPARRLELPRTRAARRRESRREVEALEVREDKPISKLRDDDLERGRRRRARGHGARLPRAASLAVDRRDGTKPFDQGADLLGRVRRRAARRSRRVVRRARFPRARRSPGGSAEARTRRRSSGTRRARTSSRAVRTERALVAADARIGLWREVPVAQLAVRSSSSTSLGRLCGLEHPGDRSAVRDVPRIANCDMRARLEGLHRGAVDRSARRRSRRPSRGAPCRRSRDPSRRTAAWTRSRSRSGRVGGEVAPG